MDLWIDKILNLDSDELKTLIAFGSLIISVLMAFKAIKESRAMAAQADQRAEEAKRYSQALETVIKAGQYLQYLKGVDENIGSAAKQLESIAKKSADVVELTNQTIKDSVVHLKEAAAGTDEIAKQLRHLASTTLRAQRDMLYSHKQLTEKLQNGDIGDESKTD